MGGSRSTSPRYPFNSLLRDQFVWRSPSWGWSHELLSILSCEIRMICVCRDVEEHVKLSILSCEISREWEIVFTARADLLSILSCEISGVNNRRFPERRIILSILSCEIRAEDHKACGEKDKPLSILSCEIRISNNLERVPALNSTFNSLLRDQFLDSSYSCLVVS